MAYMLNFKIFVHTALKTLNFPLCYSLHQQSNTFVRNLMEKGLKVLHWPLYWIGKTSKITPEVLHTT